MPRIGRGFAGAAAEIAWIDAFQSFCAAASSTRTFGPVARPVLASPIQAVALKRLDQRFRHVALPADRRRSCRAPRPRHSSPRRPASAPAPALRRLDAAERLQRDIGRRSVRKSFSDASSCSGSRRKRVDGGRAPCRCRRRCDTGTAAARIACEGGDRAGEAGDRSPSAAPCHPCRETTVRRSGPSTRTFDGEGPRRRACRSAGVAFAACPDAAARDQLEVPPAQPREALGAPRGGVSALR